MGRARKRPYGAEHPPLDMERLRTMARTEVGPGGVSYTVRQIAAAAKEYRCPGCNGVVAVGTSHVVVWCNEHLFGAEAAVGERRHWHSGCWRSAARRR